MALVLFMSMEAIIELNSCGFEVSCAPAKGSDSVAVPCTVSLVIPTAIVCRSALSTPLAKTVLFAAPLRNQLPAPEASVS